jgi:branched-chain amino acid transport system substrate-binding protein
VPVGFVFEGTAPTLDASYQLEVANATVGYLNEHRAGLAGRPIELVPCEVRLDPARATDCANELISAGVVAVVSATIGELGDLWRPLSEANVPLVALEGASPAMLADAESTFVLSDPDTSAPLIGMAEEVDASSAAFVAIDIPAVLEAIKTSAPQWAAAGIDIETIAVPPGTADMTPQLQGLGADAPDIVYVFGFDAFCIGAFQGLAAVGYSGPIGSVTACFTDATFDALPDEQLDGIMIGAPAPSGSGSGATELYEAVTGAFGADPTRNEPSVFIPLAALADVLAGATGDLTSASVIDALKSMPDRELPGGGGLRFRCGGHVDRGSPAACVRGTLVATIAANGGYSAFEPTNTDPIGA